MKKTLLLSWAGVFFLSEGSNEILRVSDFFAGVNKIFLEVFKRRDYKKQILPSVMGGNGLEENSTAFYV